jgi:hypothetical protein
VNHLHDPDDPDYCNDSITSPVEDDSSDWHDPDDGNDVITGGCEGGSLMRCPRCHGGVPGRQGTPIVDLPGEPGTPRIPLPPQGLGAFQASRPPTVALPG